MIDLHPAAARLADLLASVPDHRFDAPTPCPEAPLGVLIDHVGTFARVFDATARKEVGDRTGQPPPPSAANLEPTWRDRISRDLLALADAWDDPSAWEGTTQAGGIELPGAAAGLVALDELVVHGWDVAVATGQPYAPPSHEVEGARSFVASFEAPRDGTLFGPVVPVADDAPPLDRLLGLAGRDPRWRPPT